MGYERRTMQATLALSCLTAAAVGYGAGFAIQEQGVKGLGSAFAGAAATAEDPSTLYFNPAGLTQLEGSQFSVAAHVISPESEFDNQGSTASVGTPLQSPLQGGDGGDGAVTNVVPNLYYTQTVNDRVTLGLGVHAPFGLETDYPDDWRGRYHAVDSELVTLNINPSVAYQVNDRVSVGAGISAQYADARLTNKVDYGTICESREPGFPAGVTCEGAVPGRPIVPQQSDGEVAVQGDDWGFGLNLGLLYEPTARTRLGFAYRSRIEHELQGDADFVVPPHVQGVLGAGGVRARTTGAQAALDTPDTVSLAFAHRLNDRWSVMGDVTWTNWSLFDELRVEFDDGSPDSVQPEDWEDTYRYGLGVAFRPNGRWTLRGGAAYDESPIPGPAERTPRIPGNDRTWVAVGATYSVSDNMTVDVGYAHLFVDDTEIENVEPTTGHLLKGEYDNSVDILSAQANWRF